MSNVDTFRQYASQIDLSPAQLEAVTECFQACFEADEGEQADNGSEHAATETPDTTAPSEARQPHESFSDDNMFTDVSMNELLKTDNPRLAKMMNAKKAAGVSKGDAKTLQTLAQHASGGNYGSIAANEETRQRTMRWQNFLNKKLGLNLAVDGKWGKNTNAAYKQYLETKNKA